MRADGAGTRLPLWLPWPVLLTAPLSVAGILVLSRRTPSAFPLAGIALLIVGSALFWLERVYPKPAWGRVALLLWGATVSVVGAILFESLFHVATSNRLLGGMSAGVIEELFKFTGLLWLVRRFRLITLLDGAVYAGWVALGFAVAEDIVYLSSAKSSTQLVSVAVGRLLLTPFAHPLFTAFAGMGLVLSQQRKQVWWAVGGLCFAMALHGAWDMSIFATIITKNALYVGIAMVLFVVLFFSLGAWLITLHFAEKGRLSREMPRIGVRLSFPFALTRLLSDPLSMWRYRKSLVSSTRPLFDGLWQDLVLQVYTQDDASALLREQQLVQAERELTFVTSGGQPRELIPLSAPGPWYHVNGAIWPAPMGPPRRQREAAWMPPPLAIVAGPGALPPPRPPT